MVTYQVPNGEESERWIFWLISRLIRVLSRKYLNLPAHQIPKVPGVGNTSKNRAPIILTSYHSENTITKIMMNLQTLNSRFILISSKKYSMSVKHQRKTIQNWKTDDKHYY